MILGIDEVGRGPWAGPLVIGAVVLGGVQIEGLTDSKKLSKKRREELDILIREHAEGLGLGWVHADEIDQVGLSEALRLAAIRAVEQVTASYHEIVIDGTVNFLSDTTKGKYVTTLKKADLLVPSVSAASIIAKVARDAYMQEQDRLYPEYGFKSHVGYGTAIHSQAIETYGITPLHRLSFAPLKKYAKKDTKPSKDDYRGLALVKKNTTMIGNRAEDVTARHLERAGHSILERNWKTKFCEIDIVSRYKNVIYFTEVKYRKDQQQGGGMAAITSKKHRQMKFAAEYYVLKHKMDTVDIRLQAISVSGENFNIDELLEIE